MLVVYERYLSKTIIGKKKKSSIHPPTPLKDLFTTKAEMIHPLIEQRCDLANESSQIISARRRYGDMCSGRGGVSVTYTAAFTGSIVGGKGLLNFVYVGSGSCPFSSNPHHHFFLY
ncbi:hypothetical protein OUZ56_012108 [Daphnia magna]|uniref:Uncharacterized protein n=1 Tax=Daphnia magna TaxID=35525 RepID=A0ABQ9Z298_9CRUS|nr:hypothetical protein OUZ56_012108 [Daphnia magna]